MDIELKLTIDPRSRDATLSGLEITDLDSADIPLDPTFDSATSSYTAIVTNDIDEITVTPTKSDDGAGFVFLDGSNQTLADSDDMELGHQILLDVGENTFKVEVTAENSIATETYTVVVTRSAPPVTLLSNVGTTGTVSYRIVGDHVASSNFTQSQKFRTGSGPSNYILESVRFRVNRYDGANVEERVSIYTADGSGEPDSSLYLLSGDIDAARTAYTFRAPANAELEPDTDYFLHFEDTNISSPPHNYEVEGVDNKTVDEGETGWSIGDRYFTTNQGNWSSSASVLKFALKGRLAATLDATLSDLEITDSNRAEVTLTPGFESDTTEYAASVDSDIDQITVTPTKSDDSAGFEFLDGSDSGLTNVDSVTEGFQVSLSPGNNTIKVKVTAGNGNTTETYTVVVTRLTDTTLVKNTHLVTPSKALIGLYEDVEVGQRFTTGSNTAGYTLTSVGVNVADANYTVGETITARIHEFDASKMNARGNIVATLTTPTLAVGEVNFFDAPDGTVLDAETQYILNFHSTGDSSLDFQPVTVESNEQDGAEGRLIEDAFRFEGSLSSTNNSIQIEVRGNAIVPSDDATLSDLAITDSNSADVPLDPTFEPDTTDYAASVDSDVIQITVTPAKGDIGASIDYLDESDQPLADADAADGHQISLDVGETTFKVKVTSSDMNETETYRVVVTRLADRTLVKNTHLLSSISGLSIGASQNGSEGQTFATGSHADGYTISSVGIYINEVNFSGGESVTVRIHQYEASATNGLGTLVAELETPTLTAEEVNYFNAPLGTTLNATNRHVVNFDSTGDSANDLVVKTTVDDSETGATGWQINNTSLRNGSPNTSSRSMQIEVRGKAVSPSVSTLFNLEITDADGNSIALDQTFDAATTDYTTTVYNHINEITVTPTKSAAGASFEFLDENNDALVDSDDVTDGHQVELDVGDNTVKVAVTSSDTNSTTTYTVVVTRLADILVQNTHLTSITQFELGNRQNGAAGQRFTTGRNADGYEITSVGIFLTAEDYSSGETLTVRIHEFDDTRTNDLGGSVARLDTPTLTAGAVNYFTAPQDTRLDPDTEYIVNFHSTGNSGSDLTVKVVDADEQRGGTGWLIEDSRRFDGALSGTGASIQIEVKGSALVLTDDATLSALDVTDSDGDAVQLRPAFASGTTSYTASVDNSIDVLTVVPAAGDERAEIEFLDGSDQTLDDSDDMTEEHQVSLIEGANTFKVKVTSSDTTADETYTVIATRLADNTLVKNTHLAPGSSTNIGTSRNGQFGQRFTTGSNAAGYELTSVGVHFQQVNYLPSETVTVRLHEFDGSATNDLGDLVAILMTPGLRSGRVNVFRAPEGVTLKSDTQYIVNFHSTGDVTFDLVARDVSSEDEMGASDWTIEDDHHKDGSLSGIGQSFMIEVRGRTSDPADSTLSGLVLMDDDANTIALDPAFDAATTDYAASVANVETITVTPRKSAGGASFEFLDGSNNALADSDDVAEGHQVALAEGENTFKVKVTSTDTNSTTTYTVVVTRLTEITLVKNTHITTTSLFHTGNNPDGRMAQRFTTGSYPDGYELSSVGVYIQAVNFSGGETLTVRVYKFDSSMTNSLGTHVATLTTPSLVAGEVNFFDAPADTILEPNTRYMLNFRSTGNNQSDLTIRIVTDDTERGEDGWLIENSYRFQGNPATARSFMIEVRGNLAPDTTSPALLSATVDGDQLVLTYDEALDEDSTPAASAYSVTVETDSAASPSSVSVNGEAVTLTLAAAVAAGKAVTVTYTLPSENPVQDMTGNDAAALTAHAVTNYGLTPELVSNAGQSRTTSSTIDSTSVHVQRFQTGTSGAFLHSVTLVGITDLTSGDVPEVGVYTNDSNAPDTLIATLENPTTLGNGTLVFRIPPGMTAKLEPDTLYFIRIAASSGAFDITTTSSNSEDSGRLPDWSVYDWSRTYDGSTYTNSTNVIRMRLRGIEIDTKLSDLEVTDSGGNDIALTPAFDSETSNYTASVAEHVTRITVTPTKSHTDASFEYLEGSDQALSDSDSVESGHQVSLNVGINTFKVKVTAQDNT